ncbi:MAG: NAD(P)H-hydrate dehydratase [Desulfomonilaceae bacterium]|nr:NAD(P)H-hydrate dehydratase [Desulfomonilaceae bacterium]
MYLVTAEEMRAFDATAIDDYGIPGVVLMENAGRTTFNILREHLGGDVAGITVSVVAGPGNNGGDGYVIARYLINHGAMVQIFLLCPREKIKGDALINLRVLEKMTAEIIEISDEESLEEAARVWHAADVIVDAVLGTGLNSEVRSPYREAVKEINGAPGLRLAVDLPSGLEADTGRVMGVCVQADLTATYGFGKLGMALYPGLDYCGQVEVVDISIPLPAVEKNPPKAILCTDPQPCEYLQLRKNPQAHKGTFGHLFIVGGSPGKTGAPAMAAKAASRIGAGLVTVGVPASLNHILEVKLTEEMTEPLPETVPGCLGEPSISRVLSVAAGKQCLVLGPGMSTNEGMSELVRKIVEEYTGRLLIDADGLNALVPNMDALKSSKALIVLTPHPGEMARLLGITGRDVQQDRVRLTGRMAEEYGVWIVLKGARTVTASPDGQIYVNTTGNPWMASGGQGDALSGILGGLLAQGVPPEEALPFGVHLHGLAADKIVERDGPRPVTATDVIAEIGAIVSGRYDKPDDE